MPDNQVVLRFPDGDEVLKQAILIRDKVLGMDTRIWMWVIGFIAAYILIKVCMFIARQIFWAWRRRRQRRGKVVLSKKGMRGLIRSEAARKITDLIEDKRFRGIISDEVAREMYDFYGLRYEMTALIPRRPTQDELKEIIRKRLGRHATPNFPDAVEVQSIGALIERYLGVRNIRAYVIRRKAIQPLSTE